MITICHDIKYAFRQLRKNPGFTLIVVLILTIGIGATTLMFSVVNTVLLKPLPYPDADRLVMIWETLPEHGVSRGSVSYPNAQDWRQQCEAFVDIALISSMKSTFINPQQVDLGALHIPGAACSANLFTLLGASPHLGRTFTSEEDQAGSEKVVILSHGFWRDVFGSDANILGKSIQLNQESYRVVGVMPSAFTPCFDSLKDTRFWVNLACRSDRFDQRGICSFHALGKLKPDVDLAQAQQEIDLVAAHLAQVHQRHRSRDVCLVPLRGDIVRDVRLALWILFGAVGCALLIVCSNVANLILTKVTGRQREMAVRLALGAGLGRLLRQLLSESMLLALSGGLLGMLLAFGAVDLLQTVLGQHLPRLMDLTLDGRVWIFAFGLSWLVGLVCTAIPACLINPCALHGTLMQAGGRSTSAGRVRLQDGLVVTQIALSLILLIGAGLLIRSFVSLLTTDTGINTENVLTFETNLTGNTYEKDDERRAMWTQVLESLKTTPGVTQVGATLGLPFKDDNSVGFTLPESELERPEYPLTARYQIVTPGYQQAIGLQLLQGRYFNEQDTRSQNGKVVINQAMARRFWPQQNPIGQQIRPRFSIGEKTPEFYEIIGIVADTKQNGLDTETKAEISLLHTQHTPWNLTFTLKTIVPPEQVVHAIRTRIAAINPLLPVFNVQTMEQRIADTLVQKRFALWLFAGFAGVALILAMLGIHGVTTYAVSQRTQEIGIRIALGARPLQIINAILVKALRLTGIGLIIGLGGSLVLTRFMQSMLFHTKARDPVTFATVPMIIVAVVLLASIIPARKATKIDPMEALRYE